MEPSTFLNLPAAVASFLFAFLSSDPAVIDSDPPVSTSKPAALTASEGLEAFASEAKRFWAAPFVLADLEKKEVFVLGENTGMIPGDPMEFFVITEMSGQRYESLMVSHAKPSDIKEAMEKIGASPIGPVNPDQHRFWPRGDRIEPTFFHAGTKSTTIQERPLSEVCLLSGKPIPNMHWVFTSAPMLPSFQDEETLVYAPDAYSPNSIASNFNLINTVFDLPLQGSKTGVYGTFVLPKEWEVPEGQAMVLRLRPAPTDTYPPDVDLTVHVGAGLITTEGMEGIKASDLADVGSALNARENEIHYITFDFANDLTLSEATTRARQIQLLEKHVPSMRVEPPPPGQVFFQSFVPDPAFRDRQARPSQPVELHLKEDGAVIMELKEVWGEARVPEIEETQLPVASPEKWISYVEENKDLPVVLFLYADPEVSLRTMRAWTTPVLKQFPIVFIYKTPRE